MPELRPDTANQRASVPAERLRTLAAHAAVNYSVSVPAIDRPVLDGVFDTTVLPSGLIVHRVDARDLQGSEVKAVLKEGLRIAMVIGGRADVCFGDLSLQLGPAARPAQSVQGTMIAVARPDQFRRCGMRGTIERTVSITVPWPWLDTWLACGANGPAIRAFAREHLSVRSWTLSPQAVATVEQMLMPAIAVPTLWNLYLESRALGLLAEAFAAWETEPGPTVASEPNARLRPRDVQRMAQLRAWLDSGEADALSLEAIACHACMSVNTLQRHFRAAWGRTVFDYLRDAKLERARVALEQQGMSVAQAAWQAGYTSAANFSTAFRRRYGVAPGHVRASQ